MTSLEQRRAEASPVLEAGYTRWLERDLAPDWLIRLGIRLLVANRLRQERRGGPEAAMERLSDFVHLLGQSPVAIRTEAANDQHYEVPAPFYQLVLGKHLKYSCAWWDHTTRDLDAAEIAMLELTCQRARLEDGQDVLELGCGWGSLSLYMAKRFPRSRILSVSNSRSQKEFIDRRSAERGLGNLSVVTADMNDFQTEYRFDRVVSVEMFEHMRNYRELLKRIRGWCRPQALLFVHVFTHLIYAYPFEVRNASDWMAQHFFTGGVMPSDDLLLYFQDDFRICEHWRVSGVHYQKTSEAWLQKLDRNRSAVMDLFASAYGRENALRWVVRWRVFFMACAELFGFRGGQEWIVSHYLFKPRVTIQYPQ